jgi:hypothetical protein
VNLSVSHQGIYNPIFVTCQAATTDFLFTALFRNGDSYIDYRYFVSFIFSIINFAILGVILTMMVAMIWIKRAIKLKFHYYLGSALVVCLIAIVCEIWSILHRMKDPKDHVAVYLEYSFRLLEQMAVFTSLILCASGWGIHTVRMPVFSFACTVIFGLSYLAVDFLPIPAVHDHNQVYLLEYLIKIISLCVISKSMVNELRQCELYLISYVLVLSSLGIDSTTTPVSRRALMQYVILCAGSVLLFFHLCLIHTVWYFDLSVILAGSVLRSINCVFLVVLVLNYLPFK